MPPTNNSNKKNKKRPAPDDAEENDGPRTPILRRSKRAPMERDFYLTETLEKRKFIVSKIDESRGLDQPGGQYYTKEELERVEKEKRGTEIFQKYLKPAGWKWKNRGGGREEGDVVFVAPGIKKANEVKNVNMFSAYQDIFDQFEQDGNTVDKILARSKNNGVCPSAITTASISDGHANHGNSNQIKSSRQEQPRQQPTFSDLESSIDRLFGQVDLDTTTLKEFRKKIEKDFGIILSTENKKLLHERVRGLHCGAISLRGTSPTSAAGSNAVVVHQCESQDEQQVKLEPSNDQHPLPQESIRKEQPRQQPTFSDLESSIDRLFGEVDFDTTTLLEFRKKIEKGFGGILSKKNKKFVRERVRGLISGAISPRVTTSSPTNAAGSNATVVHKSESQDEQQVKLEPSNNDQHPLPQEVSWEVGSFSVGEEYSLSTEQRQQNAVSDQNVPPIVNAAAPPSFPQEVPSEQLEAGGGGDDATRSLLRLVKLESNNNGTISTVIEIMDDSDDSVQEQQGRQQQQQRQQPIIAPTATTSSTTLDILQRLERIEANIGLSKTHPCSREKLFRRIQLLEEEFGLPRVDNATFHDRVFALENTLGLPPSSHP